jgi:AraC-like DNA-binding protein
MMGSVSYRERGTGVPGVVLWARDSAAGTAADTIFPDGCMDLIWDGATLFVAGPDTRARVHVGRPDARYVGLRFAEGTGPGFLGVTADEVRDRTPELDRLWPAARARDLGERVASGPAEALEHWVLGRAADLEPPRLGHAVFGFAAGGTSVRDMADDVGCSVRQLHRRCLPLFGYGPQHLVRVLRFQRALAAARSGLPLAQVAAVAGFADQAHLTRDVRDLAGTTPARLVGALGGA